MTPRQRVQAVIEHRTPDRMPVYGWLRANLEEPIAEAFGSLAAFEDRYEFDLHHAFSWAWQYAKEDLQAIREDHDGEVPPDKLLELTPHDPDDEVIYRPVREQLEHHQQQRGRFVYVQTPGIFECLNAPFGIENHLMYLALYPDRLKEVYARQAEWNRRYALNCIDLGVDMIHVSDDWGAQRGLMFSPQTWRELIAPYHKVTADAVKQAGCYLSLHSDGNVSDVIDDVIELGFDVVHPWQESAGMSLEWFRQQYRDRLTVLGGLDVQTTVGFDDYGKLEAQIRRVIEMFRDGGLIFCTTHFIQDHCTMDELVFAFDLIHKLVRQ
jgi:uroporphyrinogen decarboxylase